jgi:antitoxin ParD1/3/4
MTRVGFYATNAQVSCGAFVMEPAEKFSITMTPEMLRVIRESVAAGEYASTSEAVRDAVRVWQRQRQEDAERLTAIRARIRRSLDDPRPDMTLEEVDAHLATLFARAEQAGGNEAA